MKKKLSSSVSVLITSIVVMFILPGSSFRMLRMYLRHYGLNANLFKFFWRSSPTDLMMLLVWLMFLVIAVISLFKIIYFITRLSSPQGVREARGSAKHVTEEAIDCAHTTGKAKYIEQIDGYLKTGLIDRAEYNALKARYERLNIPDDYHG